MRRILLCGIMTSLSIHAMTVPVAIEQQPCPGGELASQPDLRHQVTVNNKNYYLINRDGQGLTDHDRTRLQQIVPLAVDRANYLYALRKYFLGGVVMGGLILAAILHSSPRVMSSVKQSWFECLYFPFFGGLLGVSLATGLARLGDAYVESYVLQHTLLREACEGRSYRRNVLPVCRENALAWGPLTIHSECFTHRQNERAQLRHAEQVRSARMALGALYVPKAIRTQLERQNDAYKPLETYLRQSDSPINDVLNVPTAYRGNWIFVNGMMKFIHECEIYDRE